MTDMTILGISAPKADRPAAARLRATYQTAGTAAGLLASVENYFRSDDHQEPCFSYPH